MSIRVARTDDEILACFPVMKQLRPRYEAQDFMASVRRQEPEGYRLAMLSDDGEVVAVAGYRIAHNLAWGKFLYVDDLVTDASRRSAGHGRRLMNWLTEIAEREGCDELHLDSGVKRFGAHRLYLRYGMDITSHHFRLTLHGESRDQRP